MKKLVLLIIIMCLLGCEPKKEEVTLQSLGYSEDDVLLIESFPQEIIDVFYIEYNEKLLSLIHTNGFDYHNFDEYIKYMDSLSNEKIVKLVNENIVNENNISFIIDIYNNAYYIDSNEDLYLKYINDYDNPRKLIEIVNTRRYLDYFEDIITTDLSKNYLMLVNKYYQLPSDYEPDDLVQIDAHYGRGQTRKEVYEAYKALQDEANDLGYYFTVCSAYRSYNYQDGLYNKYLSEDPGGREVVDTYSARPGHSEHQSGLCLDLYDSVYGMDDFGKSEGSKWLDLNCYKYGFIIRYTEEKESITGYMAEPWQIRYVGSKEIAKDIMERGITFDEYYACFVE